MSTGGEALVIGWLESAGGVFVGEGLAELAVAGLVGSTGSGLAGGGGIGSLSEGVGAVLTAPCEAVDEVAVI